MDVPVFVERDVASDVRAWMAAARMDGGFLLLVGNSSVGKTRLIYETARDTLTGFAVLAPTLGDGGVVAAVAETILPRPGLIVWLDELQRFLPGPYFTTADDAGHTPITAAAIRRLLTSDTPVVVLGTIWPEYLRELEAADVDPATGLPSSRHPQASDILSRYLRRISLSTFSAAECAAAESLGNRDPRLRHAVADPDFNVTEALAGARQTLQRYDSATDLERAVVHAAVDARRLGVQQPLSAGYLRAAARGYVDALTPDDSWFARALDNLTSRRRREDAATAPLLEILTADRRDVVGYGVSDFLLQRLVSARASVSLSEVTWRALIDHVRDPNDRDRVADSASDLDLFWQAEALYRSDSVRLAELYQVHGYVDKAIAILRRHADAGGRRTAAWLADLLAEQGNDEELRRRADARDRYAASRLARLLAERGDEVGLRARADRGDRYAAGRLADMLADHGDLDGLRRRAEAGDRHCAHRLAELLVERGDG